MIGAGPELAPGAAPGGLVWHLPLLLVTPALLAVVAGLAAAIAGQARAWWAGVGLVPAVLLQLFAAMVLAGRSGDLAPPTTVVLVPTGLGLVAGSLVAVALAKSGRAGPVRTGLLAACGLLLPIAPWPFLPALTLVLAGGPPRWSQTGLLAVGLGLTLLVPWGPEASAVATAGLAVACAERCHQPMTARWLALAAIVLLTGLLIPGRPPSGI